MSALQSTLSRDQYISASAFEREIQLLFQREWMCAGREEAIPNGGDYVHVNLLGQQVMFGKIVHRIDVSALPQGTFIIKVGEEIAKFVKQ